MPFTLKIWLNRLDQEPEIYKKSQLVQPEPWILKMVQFLFPVKLEIEFSTLTITATKPHQNETHSGKQPSKRSAERPSRKPAEQAPPRPAILERGDQSPERPKSPTHMSGLDDELVSSVRRVRALEALERAKQSREGQKYVMVQVGPKTWVERRIKE
jgi:hypothetical protein